MWIQLKTNHNSSKSHFQKITFQAKTPFQNIKFYVTHTLKLKKNTGRRLEI